MSTYLRSSGVARVGEQKGQTALFQEGLQKGGKNEGNKAPHDFGVGVGQNCSPSRAGAANPCYATVTLKLKRKFFFAVFVCSEREYCDT